MKEHRNMQGLALLVLAALLAAPATAHENEDEDALSFDGLEPVEKGVFARSWRAPDVDFTRYDKIILGDTAVQFREVKDVPRSSNYSSTTEFPITPENREKLIREISKAFDEELRKSKSFTIVEEPGPDVMILEGALLDIVSRVPPQRSARSVVVVSRFGEATLVLQLRDSLTGRVLARGAERRAAERGAGTRGSIANQATAWNEVRRLGRRWGTKLRKGLDEIHK